MTSVMSYRAYTVSQRVYLAGYGIFSMLQWQRVCVGAAQAPECQPGTVGPDVAHSDHRAPHRHQLAKHAGTQSPQRSQWLIVIQPLQEEGARHKYILALWVAFCCVLKCVCECVLHLALI